jgi:tetratricopeptide (TPR) repeat protein
MDLRRKRVANAEKVRKLVDSAFASRYHDVPAMLTASSTAVALAEEKFDELPTDLVIAAWTQYGNALRIAGRYQEAEKALERAAGLPTFDSPTKSNLLEITGNLHRNTGRFESAVNILTSAIDEQRSCGNPNDEARIHNLLGITYKDWGNRQKALHSFRSALDLLDPEAPLDVVIATGHNLLEVLIDEGRLSAAASALALLEPFYQRLTSNRLSAKGEWVRARLCRELKQFPAARIFYERAYRLLSADPYSPELAELVKEMEELPPDK